MSLQVGEVIGRSYRLLHAVGEGGMARVWVAEHIALQRQVAIKVVSDELIQTQAALELFHREACATAEIDHPHVVRVLDFDVTDDGVPFLVLELLVGETLEQRLAWSGPLDLETVRKVLEQTCDALGDAHDCGILHRDIKAENLFLQRSRRQSVDVKLLDFGIALHKHRPFMVSEVFGTPQYMSPEQMAGSDLDERADLFSLGVCVYYALTKRFPYAGETVDGIKQALARGEIEQPVSALRADLPSGLDAWFERVLSTSRERRYASAREMFEAFEAAVQARRDTPMSVASVSVPPPPPSRRAFAVVSTLAGTLAGAAIVSAFFLGHHREVAARSVAPVVTVQAAPTAVTLSPAPETEPPMFVVTPPPSPAAPATSHPIKRAHAPRVVLGERDAAVDVVDSQDSGVEASDSIVESTAGFGNRE